MHELLLIEVLVSIVPVDPPEVVQLVLSWCQSEVDLDQIQMSSKDLMVKLILEVDLVEKLSKKSMPMSVPVLRCW